MADGSLIFDTKLDTKGISTGLKGIGSFAMGTFAGLGAVLAGGVTALGAITKSSLDAYASVEQSIGGIKTLFGTAELTLEQYADKTGQTVEKASEEYKKLSEVEAKVIENSKKAYESAGMSADQYMQTTTSFAASLKQSTSDVAEAAEVANMAVIDMSDNANKMGTDIGAIQNAYQGFAKQNYTMLDNLKLGYGGTKTEMERLLADATKLSGVKYDISNLSDVYNAIHVIQNELGITGTTAKEASATIEGSGKAMKAAWSNFLGGMGGAEQVASTFMIYAKNVLKTTGEIMKGFATEIPKFVSEMTKEIPPLIEENLPIFLDTVVMLLTNMFEMIPVILPTLLPILIDSLVQLLNSLIPLIPVLLQSLVPGLLEGFITLIMALLPMLPTILMDFITVVITLLPTIIERLIEILPMILNVIAEMLPDILVAIAEATITIVNSLVKGFFENGPAILEAGINLILKLIEGIIRQKDRLFSEALSIGKSVVDKIWNGIKAFWSMIVNGVSGLVTQVWDKFTFEVKRFTEIGKSIVDGIWSGISSGWTWLTESIGNLAGGLLNSAKKALGINSPSKKFKWLGEMCVTGFDEGIEGLMNPLEIGQAVNASLSTVSSNVKGSIATNNRNDMLGNTFNFYDTQTSPDAIKRKFENTMTFGLAGGI